MFLLILPSKIGPLAQMTTLLGAAECLLVVFPEHHPLILEDHPRESDESLPPAAVAQWVPLCQLPFLALFLSK